MKKLLLSLLLAATVAACNSNTTKSESDSKTSPGMPTSVDNVNGNVPDTTNSIQLNKPMPPDSSHMRDSGNH